VAVSKDGPQYGFVIPGTRGKMVFSSSDDELESQA
jgi:hypothetical protein